MEDTSAMRAIFSLVFDAIFPPSEEALRVRHADTNAVHALYSPHVIHDVTVLTQYRTPLMTALVHEAKFHNNRKAINLLGVLLSEHCRETQSQSMHVVPLPLSSARLRERGYNQVAEILKRACAQGAPISIHHILHKIRNTPPQTSLSRRERLENPRGAFEVIPSDIPLETPLIIFDDITTTGATLEEAARALTRAGFTHIEKLALAH